jgi:NTE family protein
VFDFLIGNGRGAESGQSSLPRTEAKTGDDVHPLRQPPHIGLALGGGAARGFAHIGIVKALIARGLKPDVIAGTSMGALVGGMYAAGQLDALEEWARGLTRRNIFGYMDFSLTGSGLIRGDRLGARLEEQLGELTIESLPLRFAAITTEIGTGHEIWLTRGRLSDSLRAAYALPGIFTPVASGHRWLVDGALVNPVPVSAARALGARLVIAVNLNADLFGRGTTIAEYGPDDRDDAWERRVRERHGVDNPTDAERRVSRQALGTGKRPGFATIMIEAFNIMQDRITRARLAGDPSDVTINPPLGPIGLFDFHRAAEAIDIGMQAANRALDPIEQAITALT